MASLNSSACSYFRGFFFTKKQIILFVLVITSIPSLKTSRVGLGELGQTGWDLGPRLLTPCIYALVLKLSQKVL